LPVMYTGYINVNATYGRNIFYWLVEADTNAASAPLIFWFQGGPGGKAKFVGSSRAAPDSNDSLNLGSGEYGLTFEM
jgi:hypothetical protein